MFTIEYIYHLLGVIFYVLLIGTSLWFIVSLFRTWDYEKEINQLYDELQKKIKKEEKRRANMESITLRIDKLKKDYKLRIEKLKRKRKFILDKLPFIK